ncbi:hypothetical protein FRACYDRAFT_236468 [Fragilariopsis cylindrus CCMP1102]|uniref:TRAF-type domain-containing protein n=1 Tax=Fragilariopsis cylindrus CCMP1102 TaxID=635003 RepID=A0A1E7FJ66_9STRA|nr:hypothetical protein FRACYDRAFT_236468 [Fragilariopsis cylindrus CCMP1102]|eukprot:OEU18197.1 hypothetical protein FRACYDRAFT_236468 [Fragilariopsis cylindrus CCMP1102]
MARLILYSFTALSTSCFFAEDILEVVGQGQTWRRRTEKDCAVLSSSEESPDQNKCPICSCESLGFEQTFALNGVVQNMKMCCMNNSDPRHLRQENDTEDDDRNLQRVGDNSSMCYCSWTGKFSEWCDHDKNSCQLREFSCSFGGCDFTGRRKDIKMHNSSSIVDHMQLLFGQRMLGVERNILQIQSDRDREKDKSENDIKILKAEFKNYQTKANKVIKDLKKTIENTREEQEKAINGFTSKMDSNNISIKVEKIEKVLKHRTRNLVVELKSELELATEFIIDAKSEDLKIDVDEAAKTIEEKLGRGLNDRFVNIASSIYTKIDADKSKIKAEMINVKEDLVEKIIQIGSLFVLRQKEEEEKRKREWEPRHDNDEPNQKKRK